tara:strand:- start:1363 stop:1539 length:177 start_codon:yes stop_codon:yes gene_type:complete
LLDSTLIYLGLSALAQAKKGGYISVLLIDYHHKTQKSFYACVFYIQQQKKGIFANKKV